jgi:L,D-peptidoglycan transpeptidase YkuD (ErfK/YbiS/YcfS/YnhG family)
VDLIIDPSGIGNWGGLRIRCALGRSGVSRDKREGDRATPVGRWPMRRLLYRADRLERPRTRLPVSAIRPRDGWCDAPQDPRYNRPVDLPYPAGAEALCRDDHVYDLVVPLGYNDAPAVPGVGSAIFLHLARPDFSPTEGCVALAVADFLIVLRGAEIASCVVVEAG